MRPPILISHLDKFAMWSQNIDSNPGGTPDDKYAWWLE